ncbi:MAG: serine/threonine protein kinase, partial [Elusimicrobia bacterium]|nr:serine/threonine protein kinase [Elusimicrobiota bacterium]
ARVYLAQDLATNEMVALKELAPAVASGQDANEALQQFRREFDILGSLKHPNLPAVHEAFQSGGRHFIAMDYVAGKTLEERLEELRRQGKTMDYKEALGIVIPLLKVLHYLHSKKIIYRDVKPSNVMLVPGRQGHPARPVLIDFGIARRYDSAKASDTQAMGTPGFASPEHYGKSGQTDARSDVFSVGAMLHYMLTGDDPGSNPFAFTPLGPRFPQALAQAVARAIEIDREVRFPDAKAMRQALETALKAP